MRGDHKEEEHRIGRLNYNKADFENMKIFFENACWDNFHNASLIS